MTSQLQTKLAEIQRKLVAPKGQFNAFGKYKYRSCEDILTALKPLLGELILTIQDDIVQLGDRYYIKATATLSDGSNSISTTAFAREEETKKGMDGAQVTGAASSYARKYALNGLFCIDDTKDADSTNGESQAITSNQVADLQALIDERGVPVKKVLAFAKVSDLKDLPAANYQRVITAIQNAKQNGGAK